MKWREKEGDDSLHSNFDSNFIVSPVIFDFIQKIKGEIIRKS